MIARAHRFHGHGSLRFVYSKGRVVRGQLFALKFIRNQRQKTYRVAVVVSRKVHKSAVVRNRIRRRLYEQIRSIIPANTPAVDLAFIVYSERVATLPTEELTEEVRSHLEQALAQLES